MTNMIPPRIRQTCTLLGAFFLLTSVASSPLYSAPKDAAPGITRVSITERSDKTGYVIRLHASEYIQAFSSPKETAGGRYEITIFNTDISSSVQKDDPEGPIEGYNITTREGHTIFRWTMLTGLPLDVSAYRDRDSHDLLVGLQISDETPDELEALPVARTGPPVEARNRWLLDTIVIDAGHGGRDPGTSKNGVVEKNVTLPVALKVGQYLEEYLGVKVVYTRTTDQFIDLKKRGQIANEAGGKLFVSIHADAQPRSSAVSGATMYILGTHKTNAARDVMERENSVVKLEDDPSAYADYESKSVITGVLAQSAYMRQSEQLAKHLEDQFAKRANRKTRGVKQAGFYVLWSASMPAVLIELGFVTNRQEARYLKSELGQTYLASAIYRAIRDFKFAYEKDLAQSTSQ